MQTQGKRLIGVYKADGGLLGEISYFLGHLVGVKECSLCDITHSQVMKKRAFKAFESSLQEKHGLQMRLVHMNERSEAELAASKGREPACSWNIKMAQSRCSWIMKNYGQPVAR